MALRRDRAIRRGNPDITQIQSQVALMHDVVVVGEADQLAIRAVNVDVASAAQCSRCKRWGDIHCIKIMGAGLVRHHATAVMEIVLP
ncbi:hypothetical protein D3C81_1685330 [compost metagenome]